MLKFTAETIEDFRMNILISVKIKYANVKSRQPSID